MPRTRRSTSTNGTAKSGGAASKVLELRQKLSQVKRELRAERKRRKKLEKALPLCPKELEDQIPDIKQIKALIASQPPLRDFVASLWK